MLKDDGIDSKLAEIRCSNISGNKTWGARGSAGLDFRSGTRNAVDDVPPGPNKQIKTNVKRM